MLCANMAQQVVLGLPLCLVVKGLWVAALLKNPASYTARLYGGRAGPGKKGPTQLFGLSRRYHNPYSLDNQLNSPLRPGPPPLDLGCHTQEVPFSN